MKCIAIDDEPLALDIIKAYASRVNSIDLVYTFSDAITAAEYLRNTKIDLLFFDINMPDISGIDLAKSFEHKPMIIFTTAYKKFAWEGFELNAVDYLLKPISFERFTLAVSKAVEFHKYRNSEVAEETDHIFVRSEYRLLRIALQDIEFIEGLEDYIKIHFHSEKPVMTLMTMKSVLGKLPPSKFRRIHRSYIVAVNAVKSVQNKKVMLGSSKELPVSDSYSSFLDEWKRK